MWDFSEMIPLLRESGSLTEAWFTLIRFTAPDGRANYLAYLQTALTWSIAGENPILWQWQRAIFMLAMGAMLVLTVRACGGTPLAGIAAGVVMLLSVSGADGWALLMGEPLVVILLCSIIQTGQSLRRRPEDTRRVVWMAIATGGVILTKEVAIVLLPASWILALAWHPERGFGQHMPTHRLRELAILGISTCALTSLPFLLTLAAAGGSGYASGYAVTSDGLARVPALLKSLSFPSMYFRADLRTALFPANLAWISALGTGLAVSVILKRANRDGLLMSVLLSSMTAAGALVYAFWPRYSPFYGIPFMMGSAGLLAVALTTIQRRLRLGGLVATAFAAVITGYAGIIAYQIVNERRAFADLAHSTANALAADMTSDSILVIKPVNGRNRWPITGAELGRYAVAIGLPAASIPTLVDVSCEVAAARLGEPAGRTGFLNDQNTCGPLPTSTLRLVAVAQRVDWVDWTSSDDSLVIQLLLPSPLPPTSHAPPLTPPDTAAGSATAPAGP